MKKIVSVLLFALSFGSIIVLTSCDNSTKEQDEIFVQSIKNRLTNIGDYVKVSDLHISEWDKVCMVRGGVGVEYPLRGIAEQYGLSIEEIDVINREKRHVKYIEEFGWGIYFFYEPNQIEYFKIEKSQMLARPDSLNMDEYGCVKRGEAFFFRPGSKNKKEKNPSSHYYLGLTNSNPNQGRYSP